MTKYLKHINPFITTYLSGKLDITSITATPGEIILYDNIIIEDSNNENYNASLWDDYITKGFWTIINIIVWEDYSTQQNDFYWPISGASGNFTFVQGSFISDNISTLDNFTITQIDNTISNNSLSLTAVVKDSSLSSTSKYNCTVTVNGKALFAILTIIYNIIPR